MRKPAIGFVLACVFLDALGIGLIVPVLPRLIGSLADTRDLQTSWYGAIMVSYGLMQFFFAPILGALSDRIGRRDALAGDGLHLGGTRHRFAPGDVERHWYGRLYDFRSGG